MTLSDHLSLACYPQTQTILLDFNTNLSHYAETVYHLTTGPSLGTNRVGKTKRICDGLRASTGFYKSWSKSSDVKHFLPNLMEVLATF